MAVPAPLRLSVVSGPSNENPPRPYTMQGGATTIGRRDDCSWVLPDASAGVSRQHAMIQAFGDTWQLVDQSANGTFVNGQLVGRGNPQPLNPGDTIRVGEYEIVVEAADAAAPGFDSAAASGGSPTGTDPFGLSDLAQPGFGAAAAQPRGPSPFDQAPPPPQQQGPANSDMFGEFGSARAGDASLAATGPATFGANDGMFDARSDAGNGSPFPGATPARQDWPSPGGGDSFGAAGAGADPFGAATPSGGFGGPPPQGGFGGPPPQGGFDGTPFDAQTDPLATPPGSQFAPHGDPLAAMVDPFAGSPQGPAGFNASAPQSPFGLNAVSMPSPSGPGQPQQLPADWLNASPDGLSAPPADLDPIEAALAGLAPRAPARLAPDPRMQGPSGFPDPSPAGFGAATPDPPPARRMPAPAFAPPQVPSAGPHPEPAAARQFAPPPPVAQRPAPAPTPAPPPASAPVDDPFAGPPAPRPATARPARPAPPPPPPPAAAQPTARPAPPPAARAEPPPSVPRRADASPDAMLQAFLDGAKIGGLPVDADHEQAMRTLGASTRAIVSTLARLLEARRLLKGEFRISQTVVAARENNPLKFSADEGEMLLVMLGAVRPGFQSGEAAVWDAGRDLEAHQLSLLAAFRAVIEAVFARLSPETIAAGEESGFFGRVVPSSRDAARWGRYEKTFGELRQDIGDTLAGRLGQIFAEAYEKENGRRGGSR